MAQTVFPKAGWQAIGTTANAFGGVTAVWLFNNTASIVTVSRNSGSTLLGSFLLGGSQSIMVLKDNADTINCSATITGSAAAETN